MRSSASTPLLARSSASTPSSSSSARRPLRMTTQNFTLRARSGSPSALLILTAVALKGLLQWRARHDMTPPPRESGPFAYVMDGPGNRPRAVRSPPRIHHPPPGSATCGRRYPAPRSSSPGVLLVAPSWKKQRSSRPTWLVRRQLDAFCVTATSVYSPMTSTRMRSAPP